MATFPSSDATGAGEERFRELVEPHLAGAYRVALLIVLDRELARDAVQEALIRAFRGLDKLRPDSNFKAWFRRLVVNEARRMAGRRRRLPVLVEELPEIAAAPAGAPEPMLLAREERERVWAAMADLDELHRTVLVLRYYQELTDAEIAEALAIPVGTVKSRLNGARRRLQERLAPERQSVSARLLHLLPRR